MGFKIKKPDKGAGEWIVAELEDGFNLKLSKSGDLLTLMCFFSKNALSSQEV